MASFAASAARPGAPQQLVIRLDPFELGRVQVSIERTPGGPARVELIVERPDTLLLLLRDQPQLQRALDLAGVPAANRTLHFHLAPSSTGADSNAPGLNFSNGGSSTGNGGSQQRHPSPHHNPGFGNSSPADDPASRPGVAWRQAGIDITA